MGNGMGRLSLCFAGKTSRRRHGIAVNLPDPLDEGLGHSFCYTRPDPSRPSADSTASFCTISGASISANTRTSLSTTSFDSENSSTLDKASSFHSSNSFASLPLQPIPHNSSFFSAPIPQIERGFLSGPIERSFISIPLKNQSDKFVEQKPKSNIWDLKRIFKRTVSKSIPLKIQGAKVSNCNKNLSIDDENYDECFENQNLQWAQGKAGEDRIHVVISEENSWVFVGIYDGFNGPDATDYLLNTLYKNVYNKLKGLLWNDNPKTDTNSSKSLNRDDEFENGLKSVMHSEVLKAFSEGLRKTEEGFLEIADMMFDENPELSLMGSCVLAMLMKGDDVYLMNVGDSRVVLAQKKDMISTNDVEVLDIGEGLSSSLDSCQLTVDHSTSVQEEVLRIKREHLDDDCAVMKDRVKGSLKVTRALGAGFLKKPKWNNALLEMFRIDYVGTSPYITCTPSLYHHTIGPKDRFLILSSDGLYQYLTNEEAVSEVEMYIALFPEGDPAQHLVEEVLFRAAKKAGIHFHELLDIPQGDRRKYHDDVSVIIISFEGRIWRSSV